MYSIFTDHVNNIRFCNLNKVKTQSQVYGSRIDYFYMIGGHKFNADFYIYISFYAVIYQIGVFNFLLLSIMFFSLGFARDYTLQNSL